MALVIIVFVAFSFLCLESLSLLSSPFGVFPHFLHEFSCIWCCCSLGFQTKGNIYCKIGLATIHEIVGAEPLS